MIIHEIYINSFGRLKDYSQSFNEGLNIICKENGSGKTTVAMFIYAVFYGLQKSKVRSLDNNLLNKYKPWLSNLTGGTITFSFEGKRYRIERDFGLDRLKVIDLSLNKECNFGDPGERVFGIDRNAFLKSIYIRQSAWTSLSEENGADGLNKKLAEFTENSGGDVGCDTALELLDSIREQLSKKSGRGELDICRQELRAVDNRIALTENEYDRISVDSAEAARIRKKIEALKIQAKSAAIANKIFITKRKIIDAGKAADIRSQIESLEKRIATIRYDMDELKNNSDSILTAKEACALNGEVLSAEEEYRRLKGNYSLARDELQGLSHEKDGLITKRRECLSRIDSIPQPIEDVIKPKKSRWGIPALLFALLALASSVTLLFERIMLFIVLEGICATLCGVFVLLWLRNMRSGITDDNDATHANALILELRAKLNLEIRAIDDKLLETDFKIQQILKQVDSDNIASALIALTEKEERAKNAAKKLADSRDRYDAFIRQSDEALSTFKLFTGNAPVSGSAYDAVRLAEQALSEKIRESNFNHERLVAERIRLAIDLAKIEVDPQTLHRLTEYCEYEMTNLRLVNESLRKINIEHAMTVAHFDGSSEIDEKKLLAEAFEAEKTETALTSAINERSSRIPLLSDLYNERARLSDRVGELSKKLEAVEAAKKCLITARDRVSHSYIPKINEEFNKAIKYLSNDKIQYCEINSSFEIAVIDGGFSRELAYYSSGTKELIEFILRLSLIKAMYGDVPFLMLDDCFTNLDDDTLLKIESLLKQISREKQIIYFTCHKKTIKE